MYDAIVIGVGGMGSAAVYHLALRGASVLGLEQFDIPHVYGSSHGISRIIRLGYAEGSFYVPLLWRAYDLWLELENRTGERLLMITGGLDAAAQNSETVQGVVESCARSIDCGMRSWIMAKSTSAFPDTTWRKAAVLAMLDILVWHFYFGYVKVPIDKMISMRIHSIDAKFIKKMAD